LRQIVVEVLKGAAVGDLARLEAGAGWPVLRVLLKIVGAVVTSGTDNELGRFLA
jgi:hypothetical protein